MAILAGTAPTFPHDRWDLLLPQAELTLNLLRPSPQPTMSAWHHLFGPYNFDATPMGPAGCWVLVHTKASIRRSWENRCHEGFYIGPSLVHYRCYRVLNTHSGAVTISDALKFRHHYLPTPELSTADKLLHGATPPSYDQLGAIATLRTILHQYRTHSDVNGLTAPTTPGVHADANTPSPGVHANANNAATPSGVSTKTPPLAASQRTTETEWTTVPRYSQRTTTAHEPDPIATRTRSKTNNRFAALAEIDNNEEANGNAENSKTMPYDVACPVLDAETGKLLEHRQLRQHAKYKEVWDTSYANELGRLCQGVGQKPDNPTEKRVEGTDTFRPIQFHDIPPDRRMDVTYTRVVCEIRPQKQDPNRTRITIGGNRICYPHDTGTKTGSLELVKLQLNSVLSTPDAMFACFDLENFYLGTPLDRPEYVRIQYSIIPNEFILEYNLATYVHNGWVYFEISKGVYGLKQSGKLANDLLTERLSAHDYYQCATTPGLWRHKWRPVSFVLIVDDFGIKYVGRRHAQHLLTALQENYKVTTDWDGKKFAGIDLKWDYNKRTCRLSMDGYIAEVLQKYNHPTPRKAQHSPHAHREIIYGAKQQLIPDDDTSERLDEKRVKRIQGIIGSLLYYARAVDNKLLTTLSSISAQQATATVNTEKAVNQLLDYVATYPNDGVLYRASAMVLAAHSDASFLTEPKSRSRAGAHIFLSEDEPIPRNNGPVLTISQIIKFVMASAAEAELAALYNTAREMIPL